MRAGKSILCNYIFELIPFINNNRFQAPQQLYQNISFRKATIVRDSADVFLSVRLNWLWFVVRLMWKVTHWQGIQVVVFWSNCICRKDVIGERWGAATSRILENIIISQLWDTNYLWLKVIHSITMVCNLSLYYLLCSRRTRCHRCGKICFAHSLSSGPQLWSSSGVADGSKVLQPEPPPVQILEYLSDSKKICYANHYSYLTTCGVATGINGPLTLECSYWCWQPQLLNSMLL